jgi:hypothetical protein
MTENPLRHIILTPCRLVMRESACFYCGAPSNTDTIIEYLYGIRNCTDHAKLADRDCKAHLHELKTIPLTHAYNHPILKQFLDFFDKKVYIRRSNGNIDGGWMLQPSSYDNPHFISLIDTQWSLPMTNGSLNKNVPINNFLENDLRILNEFSEGFYEALEEAVDALVKGIYINEYDEFKRLESIAESKYIEEAPGIYTGLLYDENNPNSQRIVRFANCHY